MKLVFDTIGGNVSTLEDVIPEQEYDNCGIEVYKGEFLPDNTLALCIEFQNVARTYLSLEEARLMADALIALCKDEPVKIS